MTIDDKIRDEKLQYDIYRSAAKIYALSLGKIDKYEDLTGEILPPRQHRIIQEAKLISSPLAKTLKKQANDLCYCEKQVETFQSLDQNN